MPNMSLKKNEMPSQDPQVRSGNFLEVALGYTEEQALDEAARCLNCKKPFCVDGCPVNVQIPQFIQKISEKDYEGAYQAIHATNSLPAVCGRVCPQETQCESLCVRGKKGEPVGIGRLERFAADWHNANVEEAPAKPEPTTATRCPLEAGFSGASLACWLCQSATKRSRRPMPTGSPFLPRTQYISHWVSWGQTRPQTAGRAEVLAMIW